MASTGVTVEGAVAKKAKAAAMPSAKTITWLTMCFMTVSAVASIRNTPSMAVYGLACIFLYALPAIVFLMPTSLVAAELASGWDGGVYNWVRQGIRPAGGLHRHLDAVRDDPHVLPQPARLRGQHARLRLHAKPGHQRRTTRRR